jgi:GTP-binding protein EngB required for normal cell division
MGLWDVGEDLEDFYAGDFVQEEGNRYLSDANEAMGLVAKVIPISRANGYERKNMRKIDDMLKADFLSAFKKVQLTDEAQLQMKLSLLADKLVEQKKYEMLKHKSVVGLGGKFSAGKSKFINSILKAGEELLPEDQNPTTSIPTYIVYGKEEAICAYTSANEKITLDVEALQALTHKFYEKYKMGFSSFINSLIISEPDMPYRELAFLDTPGYSKADAIDKGKKQKELSDENKAYVQLRSVDYLIWLMDIENGELSNTDIQFISKLEIETPILIVVNKADKKTDEEIQQIVDQVKDTAKNNGLNVFGVTVYSARTKTEWGGSSVISDFLEKAKNKSGNDRDNVLEQIEGIEQIISEELDLKIGSKKNERNKLYEVIYKSDDIMEIKSLITLYGESMEEIRDMNECRRRYRANSRKLERALDNQYGRR